MKITDLLGEATEYDKKQAVERKKVKSWLKSVSAFANTSLSRSTVQRAIKELTEMGRLERVGSKKTGSWIVKE